MGQRLHVPRLLGYIVLLLLLLGLDLSIHNFDVMGVGKKVSISKIPALLRLAMQSVGSRKFQKIL